MLLGRRISEILRLACCNCSLTSDKQKIMHGWTPVPFCTIHTIATLSNTLLSITDVSSASTSSHFSLQLNMPGTITHCLLKTYRHGEETKPPESAYRTQAVKENFF